MRKVLSFVLVLALVLGSFSFAFAAVTAPSDVADTDFEAPVTVLMSLGIVTGYPDGTYKPGGAVTRAEMAAMIVRALGLEDTAAFVGKSNYSDMAGNWADKYVAVSAGKNIVKGYPDGTFKPNAPVSFAEAITMIVRALGYIDGCESLVGTWPANYLSLAEDLGITDDVKVVLSGAADRGAIAQMIYNALTCYTVTVDKEGSVSYYWNSDEEYVTLLTKLDCYEDDVLISAAMADDEDTLADLSDYVYAWATVYYNDDDQLIAVKDLLDEDPTDEDIQLVNVKGEFDFDDLTVTDADDNEYAISPDAIDEDTNVYLNGEQTSFGDVTEANDLIDGWEITVYGGYEDGEDEDVLTEVYGIIANVPTYECLVTEDDVNDIADAIEDGNGNIFDVELPTIDDDGDALDLADITVTGDVTALADIQEDDVVLVFASADKTDDTMDKVTFLVERSTAEFKVKKIDKANDYVYSTDGTKYEAAGDQMNVGMDDDGSMVTVEDFEVGNTYTCYLDAYGYIYAMEETDTTPDLYALVIYILDGPAGDFAGEYDQAQIKMLTSAGDVDTFDVVDEGFDNDDDQTMVDEDNAWVDARDVEAYDLVTYSTNSDGEIDEMTVVKDSSLIIDATLLTGTYNETAMTLGKKDVASDAVVFDLSDVTTDSAASLKSDGDVTKLEDDAEYTYVYYMDDDEINVVVAYSSDATDDVYFAINTMSDALDDSDDPVYDLEGFIDGAAVDKTTVDDSVIDDTYTIPAIYWISYDGDQIDEVDALDDGTGIDWTDGDTVDASTTTTMTVDGDKYVFADDMVVYVGDYGDDDAIDEFVVGDAGDIDRGDFVQFIYSVDDDEVILVLVTDKDDIQYMD